MIKPFESAQIKIDRAKRHLQEFRSEVDNFFKRGSAYVALEIAPEYGEAAGIKVSAFTYRQSEPIPNAWAAIIGDVFHNLRGSLDLMATDAHRVSGCNPNHISDVHYPFCKDKDDLREVLRRRKLSKIHQTFLDIIEQTAPYKTGNHGLRAIHDLDILDKHQALVPTIAVVEINWPVPITSGQPKFATTLAKDGQRLMIFPSAFAGAIPPDTRIKADFSIVFSGQPFLGSDVAKQLQACIDSIEVIRTLFSSAADNIASSGIASP
ncbi:MAG: hypothetical protein ACYC56_14255 [Candidatus Aquicultor sp.]